MARKLIAISVFFCVCPQVFGMAALCGMQCCPETKSMAASARAPASTQGMSMHEHRHHVAAKPIAEHDCMAATRCSAIVDAQQPPLVRETGAKPGTPQPTVTPRNLTSQRREVAGSLSSFDLVPPSLPLAAPLRL